MSNQQISENKESDREINFFLCFFAICMLIRYYIGLWQSNYGNVRTWMDGRARSHGVLYNSFLQILLQVLCGGWPARSQRDGDASRCRVPKEVVPTSDERSFITRGGTETEIECHLSKSVLLDICGSRGLYHVL